MTTLRDISKYSGISITTISRVLNGKKNVSEETRKKVLKILKEFGYTRTDMLKKSSKKTIGVLIPNIRGQHYNIIVDGIEKQLLEQNYEMFLTTTNSLLKKEVAVLDELLLRKVDGIIICTSKEDENYIEKLINSAIPVVVVDRKDSEIQIDSVSIDNYNSGLKAVEYLYKKGHKKILFITGDKTIYSFSERKKAFIDYAYKKKDLDIYFEKGGYKAEHGYNATKKYLEDERDRVTAIFYTNDWQAMGGIKCLHEKGIKIPEEISVMGFDDDFYSAYTYPALTTIAQPRTEIGVNAANLLIERIENRCKSAVKRKILLPTILKERESVIKIKSL
ncbi:MAG: hypothetical protein PWP28_20 [Oceanotoga sp.]|jgi:LacI family transcriptional regulator|uniref:LacI family DNA-binding transcriptional regulator n=1 Tax=Oceanotoga sp. TaxID=2108366 RepID=UPI002651FFA1|nr:LacI family DNA-binding transcriptional regulator [Oceanotoga sp.]MDN5341145.1 hypothetical protein [Oceanotoga sp.]